ncbi:protein-methionine-sulfoxide reductase catalytic subunit MsrP [Histidinibacterium lentulum]|uniref:Protein-methionine-sulfoxide reductase catalytic subunit MsrP n=1 Tax=Histidinibacterium lentulum TaxID=2480588 RepID=A0A3N2R0L1_9RHOB|nr:protein-methionine-sulfoxide reductase catalytic subunit MsrP [Histidinibacterium lentulum]ROU01011.1 protein-methionine-sulfoxide reductase catalytic subunit MsrP [Histidinibacterium lentulum]
MAHRWTNKLTRADVTPEAVWLNRRQILGGLGLAGAGIAVGSGATAQASRAELEPNSWEDITTYNNFYEFGTGKGDPAANAHQMVTEPWSIRVDGLVDNPGDYMLQDLIGGLTVEERIYRLRCVEAWSMVVPWNGIELADILDRVGVQDGARYVAFETAVQPENMVGVRRRVMPFPYVEGLRLDEAMHPLTIMATGIYDRPIPNQNGAPIRLVVPWKYGFKSIKSIVRITLTEEQPPNSWNTLQPREYGFYANVNPNVDHPRWSQADERVIGSGGGGLLGNLQVERRPTEMFNGYEEEVAGLYEGMDLSVFY